MFLDCSDIRRIRDLYHSGNLEFLADWRITQKTVHEYLANFPTAFDPDASWNVLWWGSGGNYIARDIALLYLVTGDEDIARDILRLLELVRANTPQSASLSNFDSPNGRGEEYSGGVMSHPQYGAVPIQSTFFAYLSIRDTILLDDNQRATYDLFFQHQAELLEQAAIFRGNTTPLNSWINRNVPFAANVAALTIARAFPENPNMQALDVRLWPRLEWQLANWWEADGGWGENTQGYGFSMLESLLLLAETSLRNAGPNLYVQNFDGNSIRSMCRFYLETVTPEGTTPALNETSNDPIDPGLFSLCGFRTDDPQLYFSRKLYNEGRHNSYGVDATSFITPFHLLAWAGLDDRPAETPDHTSVLLPSTGVAILRNGWTRDSQYALLQFTASRVHQEYSYGTLYLYAHGPWLVGNGYNTTGRPSDQHSTLAMDNSDQTNTGGELVAFADLGSTGIAAVTSSSYPNLQHTRLVLWNEPWSQWIVVDDAVGDMNQHTLQQRWYVRGGLIQKNDNVWIFSHESNDFSLTIQMSPGGSATFSEISRHYDWEQWVSDANGVRMDVTYPGKPVRLITSFSTALQGDTVPVITRTDGLKGTQIDSRLQDTTWTWVLPDIVDTDGAIGNFALSGTAGCIWRNSADLSGYCLFNGASLSADGLLLAESSTPLSLEVDFEGNRIFVDGSIEETLTIYWPTTIKSIADQSGHSVEYKLENNQLTFLIGSGLNTYTIKK
jgi:hypothetical protein